MIVLLLLRGRRFRVRHCRLLERIRTILGMVLAVVGKARVGVELLCKIGVVAGTVVQDLLLNILLDLLERLRLEPGQLRRNN